MSDNRAELVASVRLLRLERDWTIAQLAAAANVRLACLTRILAGNRRPSERTAYKLQRLIDAAACIEKGRSTS